MDLGIFKRSEVDFFAWILAPLLFLGVVYYATKTYCTDVDRNLHWRSAFAEQMPAVQNQLASAQESMAVFNVQGGGMLRSQEGLTDLLNDKADGCSFTINSLKVDEIKASSKNLVRALRVSLKGEGSLLSLAHFIDVIQREDELVTIETGKIRIVEVGRNARYTCSVTLKYYDPMS